MEEKKPGKRRLVYERSSRPRPEVWLFPTEKKACELKQYAERDVAADPSRLMLVRWSSGPDDPYHEATVKVGHHHTSLSSRSHREKWRI